MGRKTKIAINVMALLAIIAYIVISLVAVDNRGGLVRFSRLDIEIEDSATVGFVTRDSLSKLVLTSIAPIGRPLSEIHLGDIENRLQVNSYIDSVEVSASIDGVITVRLNQHRPVMRLFCENGYDFLIDTALNIMRPTDHFHPKVPIVSGNPCFGFAPTYNGELDRKKYAADAQNLKKLINFVEFIAADQFLDRLCAQIFVTCTATKQMDIEIVPTVGRSIVLVGGLDDCEAKLDKVKAFYRSAYSYAGLDTASVVDIRFKDQILVR